MTVVGIIKKLKNAPSRIVEGFFGRDQEMLALGRILSDSVSRKNEYKSLKEIEFKIFSQFGDDGIIQWLINKVDFKEKTFIEFGVQDYKESNTRFLMMNDNWSGMVIDGSSRNIKKIVNSSYYWRYDLQAVSAFITQKNINDLLASAGFGRDLGLLSIDIDGMDYWIWQSIEVVNPRLLIVEYNSLFGSTRSITVPYSDDFERGRAHYSNLYFGASLMALCELSSRKGYSFVGCNSAGNNAFFVRKDIIPTCMSEISLEMGYVAAKFRECRDKDGILDFSRREMTMELISGLPVYNTHTGSIEPF